MRRVVVTGLGCVTPLGADVPVVWERLINGQSGVGPITTFDASSFPVRIAAEVRNWDLSDVGEEPTRWASRSRQTQFAVGAALKAARGAGLDISSERIDPTQFGIYLGCGEIFPNFVPFADEVLHRARPKIEAFELQPEFPVVAGLVDEMAGARGEELVDRS